MKGDVQPHNLSQALEPRVLKLTGSRSKDDSTPVQLNSVLIKQFALF